MPKIKPDNVVNFIGNKVIKSYRFSIVYNIALLLFNIAMLCFLSPGKPLSYVFVVCIFIHLICVLFYLELHAMYKRLEEK